MLVTDPVSATAAATYMAPRGNMEFNEFIKNSLVDTSWGGGAGEGSGSDDGHGLGCGHGLGYCDGWGSGFGYGHGVGLGWGYEDCTGRGEAARREVKWK